MVLCIGQGYLTLKFKHASLAIENKSNLEFVEGDGDQPYIYVYLNDSKEVEDTSPTLNSCYQCDFNYYFESGLIDFNTRISFAVWDKDKGHDAGFFQGYDKDDKIIAGEDTERTIAQYLQNGLHFSKHHYNAYSHLHNYMETVAFWADEYEPPKIDSAYLRH